MQKKILATLAVIIIIIAAIGIWQLSPQLFSTSSPADARNIKIGLVAPISKSPVGQDMERAARMAVDEINNAGGIYVKEWNTKVNITLITADTIDDAPGNAVTPVTRAVESDQVDLLIGGYGSAGTLANERVAIDNKVPYIITGASNQLVTRRGPQGNYGGLPAGDSQRIEDAEGMSYMFHYCTTTYHYSKTVVDFFANSMKPLLESKYGYSASRQFRLAILYRDDAFGNGVEQASKYWIQNESLPIEVVADRKYPTTTLNFQTDLGVIKDANPDAVFVVDNPDRTPNIIKQGLTDVGLKTVYISVENNEDPVFYDGLKSAGDGQLLESKFAPFVTPPYLQAVQTYTEKYDQIYGIIPGMMGADTYDAFYIAKYAIEQAGTINKADVRAAIENSRMDQMLILTETGKIQFSTGVDYHEIAPITFIEQLRWDAANSKLNPVIVWPTSVAGIGTLKQEDFELPDEYQPGGQ